MDNFLQGGGDRIILPMTLSKCWLNWIQMGQTDLGRLTSPRPPNTHSHHLPSGHSVCPISQSISLSSFPLSCLHHSIQSCPASPACHSHLSTLVFSNYQCQHSFPSVPISPAQACSPATACISFFFCLLSTVFPMLPMSEATCLPPACWPSYRPFFFPNLP